MGILQRLKTPTLREDTHPLVDAALEHYFDGGAPGFSENYLAGFSQSLVEVCTERKRDLPWVMMSAVKFSMYLDQELGHREDCNALLESLAVALPFIKLNNEPVLEYLRDLQRKKKQDDYRELIANDLPKIAPVYGTARPQQTVSINDIRPRRKFK